MWSLQRNRPRTLHLQGVFHVSNSKVGVLSSATSKVLSGEWSLQIQTFTFLSHLSQQFPGMLISFLNRAKLLCQVIGSNCIPGLAMPSDTELLYLFPCKSKPGEYSQRKIQLQRTSSNINKRIQHSWSPGLDYASSRTWDARRQ